MAYVGIIFSIAGSLGLFLYGMKVMSDGVQQAAGQGLHKALTFMTGNRLTAVLTGFGVTTIIQSSSATTVMVVSFVNAGLLTLTQAIGVIMGANVGTTITAWIVSLFGFSFNMSAMTLPAVGIGFIMSAIKWKHKDWGVSLLGFGLLFMGLDFLTKSLPELSPETLSFINAFSDRGFTSIFLGTGVGVGVTLLIHSSSAATAIFLTLAHQGTINYEMAAAMILGANIGTTVDAALASFGAKPAAKQAALVHILFNVIGTIWALFFFRQLLAVVNVVTPGTGITNRLAMFHTVFNIANTLVFFPFVNQFALLVTTLIKDKPKDEAAEEKHYKLSYTTSTFQNTPELNIYRIDNEIKEMAGIVSSMYGRISTVLDTLIDNPEKEKAVEELAAELKDKEVYADEMRDELTHFLMECNRQQITPRSERRISRLLRIITDLENMTDDCYKASLILERSVRKDQLFTGESMKALVLYTGLVGEFLNFVQTRLGRALTKEESKQAALAEKQINKERNKLRKYGRKRIEAGESVKTELLFIDFIRILEQLGDYCYHISDALAHLEN